MLPIGKISKYNSIALMTNDGWMKAWGYDKPLLSNSNVLISKWTKYFTISMLCNRGSEKSGCIG